MWLRELKDKNPVTLAGDYHKVVDAQYPLAQTAFELSNESQPEANAAKVVLTGHVTPREEGPTGLIIPNLVGLLFIPEQRD